jgi:hypothetical protein
MGNAAKLFNPDEIASSITLPAHPSSCGGH